jgi:hypothetical protein
MIASKVVGEGEVVFITTSLDEQWGKFPSDGRFFVPFSRYLILHLTNRKAPGGTITAGNPLVWVAPDSSTAYELVKPPKPGETYRQRVKLDVPTPATGQNSTVTTVDTFVAGIYNIVPTGRADDAGPLFAINPDLQETQDLSLGSDEDVRNWVGYRVPIIQAGAGTASAVSEVRTHSEWTVWVLILLVTVLVAEAVWAWVCGRAL